MRTNSNSTGFIHSIMSPQNMASRLANQNSPIKENIEKELKKMNSKEEYVKKQKSKNIRFLRDS